MSRDLYRNKYRIPSARLSNWDYRSSAPYFITICTHNRQMFFGKIENNEMQWNDIGNYANECINFIGCGDNDNKSYISIINQIVMPNHVHILLELKNHTNDYQPNRFGPLLQKSVSSVINHYKGNITKFAKQQNIPKIWQPRFHDHIVQNQDEYLRIFNYINSNPKNWDNDKFFEP